LHLHETAPNIKAQAGDKMNASRSYWTAEFSLCFESGPQLSCSFKSYVLDTWFVFSTFFIDQNQTTSVRCNKIDVLHDYPFEWPANVTVQNKRRLSGVDNYSFS
jgi:hypothetical protein